MSNQLIDRIYDAKLGDPVLKAILVSLADQANAHGFCWPCVDTIHERTEWTRRSIQNKLKEAERRGLIKRRPRKGHSTQYLFNITLLDELPRSERDPTTKRETSPFKKLFDAEPEDGDLFGARGESHTEGVNLTTPRGESDDARGESPAPRTPIEPSIEPPLQTLALEREASDERIIAAFEEGWKELVAKHDALTTIRVVSAEREKRIVKRVRDHLGKRPSGDVAAEFLTDLFTKIDSSRYLTGQIKDWRATFDWLLAKKPGEPPNMTKVMENNYVDGPRHLAANPPGGVNQAAYDRTIERMGLG